ncbi:translocation protein SEC62 [Nematocida homosporus]|uniref:translocation protein SEC62 n=1 Tax=Nematocida homosporus TaxID=1912981 RepID=UPI00221FB288|nr:translocation protein SEC62 [Nematocida homosporus]KAI5185527.1 translocation protein SEC62 [Nematocida homosporus]
MSDTQHTFKEHFSVKEAEKHLRNIETVDAILNRIKRIRVFKGTDALKYLMNQQGLVSTEAKLVMETLLENHYISRVQQLGDQYTLDIGYSFNINHEYIWLVDGSRAYTIGISVAILVGALIMALFPIWPRSIKMGTGYLFYLIFGLFILLISISIVRLIVYLVIKAATGQNFWIFPNLYEDCGILESFVPLYGWTEDEAGQEQGEDCQEASKGHTKC